MTEPSSELREALQQVGTCWDEARTLHTWTKLGERKRRRRIALLSTGGATLSSAAIILFLSLGTDVLTHTDESKQSRDSASTERVRARGGNAGKATAVEVINASQSGQTNAAPTGLDQPVRHLSLPDGSSVQLLDDQAHVTVSESGPRRITLRLNAGHARFRVTHRPKRRFRVLAGSIAVEVLGTTFSVSRELERASVAVQEGRVVVRVGEQSVELQAGEAKWFPTRRQVDADEAQSWSTALREQGERKRNRPSSWRRHAEQGDFKRAFALLRQEEFVVAPKVAELMLAADAARLSGHPQAAVPYLRKVVEQHPDDPRAPLAAFTLGGVLMNQLGLPREAGIAYAKARAGTRSAALSQDALARQVEAAHRAGDETLARQLAERYVSEYPRGRRLRAVRRFGGLR